MDIPNALLNRRSIRKYTNEKINREKLEEILKAAMYAPSAMNTQAWHFVVIDDRSILDGAIDSIHYAEMLKQASAAILVCGNSAIEKNESWLLQNCSAATQNILLSAYGLGIGSCWIAVHGMDEVYNKVKAQFKLPANIVPISLISLGYPDEEVKADERFKKDKIHFNKW